MILIAPEDSPPIEPNVRSDFRRLKLDVHYQGRGEVILSQFVAPVLEMSMRYDRLTSFFDARALLAISHGIESIWRRKGRMRLIIGVHSVPQDLLLASVPGKDWTQAVIDSLRARLMSQVSTISDELLKNRIATLAWMIKDGLLEVRVAAPTGRTASGATGGMFHMKHFVFEDESGNTITAVGSPNETSPGMSTNFEEITVHMSWRHGSARYIEAHRGTFETIWRGDVEGLDIRPLDDAFANELLRNLGQPEERPARQPIERPSIVKEIIDVARKSPAFSFLNSGPAALYPHQERAFMDGLSRWPVRVLFADEVGLGKTLEAGAAISYMYRFASVRRIVILAPKNLLRQWQDELRLHFGLSFWLYDSTERAFISPDGDGIALPRGESPVGDSAPDLTIVSAQLARGMRGDNHIFKNVKRYPDLLVVDEAHAARLKPDLEDKPHPTRLFNLVKVLSSKVQHLILVTATPLQIHWMEYHATLSLLGLPGGWNDGETYQRSLRVLANPENKPSLEDAKWVLRGIGSSISEMDFDCSKLSEPERKLAEVARKVKGSPTFEERMMVVRGWQDAYRLFVRVHPGHVLTIRNTRKLLENYGYSFPERNLQAPIVSVPADVNLFYDTVDRYLSEGYGKVEQAANPGKTNVGFAKCTYQQRLASSLHAARLSLERRLLRIEGIGSKTVAPSGAADEDEPEDESTRMLDSPGTPLMLSLSPAVTSAAAVERLHLRNLLDILDMIRLKGGEPDPKIAHMLGLLDKHIGKDRVLVFSHFTDTLDGCLDAFFTHYVGGAVPAHALYTGKEVWMDRGDGQVPASKEDIKDALNKGWLSVVFCSDAASEGLNLQAARVIINIDVPWNPARLEQRIGRIDRLGQTEPVVDIYNLWYPDSVEARMYERLLSRREDYQLAVGETPELISEAIRIELSNRLGSREVLRTDPFQRLQLLRQESQHRAMHRIWDAELETAPVSTIMRRELLEIIYRHGKEAGWKTEMTGDGMLSLERPGAPAVHLSAEPGRSDSLTLTHPVIDMISQIKLPSSRKVGEQTDLCVVMRGDVPFTFCIKDSGRVRLVPPEQLPGLMGSVIDNIPINTKDFTEIRLEPDGSLPQDETMMTVLDVCRWLPNHSASKTVIPESRGRITALPMGDGRWDLRSIGRIASSK